MTQSQLIIQYLNQYGKITPAKMSGKIYLNNMFGSETSRECRRLRKNGILKSHQEGRFEVFTLLAAPAYEYLKVEGMDKFVKVLVK